MYASALCQQQSPVNIKAEVKVYFDRINHTIIECVPGASAYNPATPINIALLSRLLTLANDFMVLMNIHLNPQRELIAAELFHKITDHIRAAFSPNESEINNFENLMSNELWQETSRQLQAQINDLQLDRGDSGRRGSALQAEDANADIVSDAYARITKFFEAMLTLTSEPDATLEASAPIAQSPALAQAADPNTMAATTILTHLKSLALRVAPSQFLAECTIQQIAGQMNPLFSLPGVYNIPNNSFKFYLNFRYLRGNDPKQQTLVFLSDLMQDLSAWHLVYSAFLDEYNVLVIDNPGVGLTASDHQGIFEVQDIADEINKRLQALKINHPHIIGQGFGSLIAIELYKKISRADRGKLVLLDPPSGEFNIPFWEAKFSALFEQLKLASGKPATSGIIEQYCKTYYTNHLKMRPEFRGKPFNIAKYNKPLLEQQIAAFFSYRLQEQVTLPDYSELNNNDVLSLFTPGFPIPISLVSLNNMLKQTLPKGGPGILDEYPELVIAQIRELLIKPDSPLRLQTSTSQLSHMKGSPPSLPRRPHSATF
jgi:pimeloyl-ACP methyl ester carboxylesterase